MRALAVLVLLCGTVFPAVLLLTLIALYIPERFTRRWLGASFLAGIAKILFNWSFPEVQVLAVIVGVVKLGQFGASYPGGRILVLLRDGRRTAVCAAWVQFQSAPQSAVPCRRVGRGRRGAARGF